MILEKQDGRLVYSDGKSTEEMMLAVAQQYPEDASADYIMEDSRYTINNTFSPVRRNLLNWYPFKPDSDILEVGAGMGSMTGLLCDVGKSVTSVEMNELRANVIRARYPDRDNLAVISADVITWNTQQRFDYIVVVGVLEYASVFYNGEGNEPQIAFLSSLRRLLNPDGVVLLAIENRFGLKYWLGGAEDHLQKPFVGIEGYKEDGTPKTFSKVELYGLFKESGFAAQRYYYVLPDYKFPTAIFTDQSLPTMQEVMNINYTYSSGSTLVANERELYGTIIANGMFPNVANSYLVEVGVEKIPQDHVIRVSARGECKPEYKIITTVDSQRKVAKKPANPRAEAHILATYENGVTLQKRGLKCVPALMEGNTLYTEYVDEPLVSSVFCDALNRGDWNEACAIMDKLRVNLVCSSEENTETSALISECPRLSGVDLGPILKDGYMDLTPSNIFWVSGDLYCFDQEWNFPDLPLRFLLYYGLKIAYTRNQGRSLFPFAEILRYIGVTEHEAAGWDELEDQVWHQILKRTGDVYGEDGYCNSYNEQLTLAYQLQENERRMEEIQAQWLDHEREAVQKAEQRLTELLDEVSSARMRDQAGVIVRDEIQRRILAEQAYHQEELAHHNQEGLANCQGEWARCREALEMEIRQLRIVNQEDAQTIQRINNELGNILNSRSWRYSSKLASILRKMFPVGSRRSSALGTVFRVPLRGYRAMRYSGNPVALPAAEPVEVMVEENTVEENFFEGFPALALPHVSEPLVTIIIPAYNQFGYTYNCLRSIIQTSENIDYEVILADDNSADQTKAVGELVENLRVIRNPKNLRFLRNCNNAAQYAKGKYILFLNNDTIVWNNWLHSLVSLMEQDETVGIAGSKLIYANNILQEAGGILWNDASAWNYGNGQNPELPEFNYLKEVDYVSGCSLIIRKNLWEEIGGFDERFAPAYCEDSDLCFEARKYGYRVVYQPLSVVNHFEGISNGTDIASGQKKYQMRNRPILMEKWRDVLEKEHYPSASHVMRARDRSMNKKIMVMVDHYIPTFDKDAGSRTLYDYIQIFISMDYHVILLPDNFNRSEYAQHYQEMGVEVLYGVWYRNNWRRWMVENAGDIDIVFLNRPHITIHYVDFVKESLRAKVLYYGMDLHFMRQQRQYELTKDPSLPLSIECSKLMEFSIMEKVDCSFYPSYEEVEYIRELNPELKVRTLPAFIFPSLQRIPYSADNRRDLMFVGGFMHVPNGDAMVWFANEIFPLVLKEMPNVRLHIMGSHTTDEIVQLASPNIIVHGFVSDGELSKWYMRCRMSVAPLRFGAGIKGKVVEAMGKGVPVVTTPIGAEGMMGADQFLAVESTAEAFAARIVSLYNDEEQMENMCELAYNYVEENFSPKNAQSVIEQAISPNPDRT